MLAISVRRSGFDWALENSCLSTFEHGSQAEWRRQLADSPVRIQWDPDKDLNLAPLPRRAIQVGLGGIAVRRYVDDWIESVTDRTELAHEVHAMVRAGRIAEARRTLPVEREYPTTSGIARRIGASHREPVQDRLG